MFRPFVSQACQSTFQQSDRTDILLRRMILGPRVTSEAFHDLPLHHVECQKNICDVYQCLSMNQSLLLFQFWGLFARMPRASLFVHLMWESLWEWFSKVRSNLVRSILDGGTLKPFLVQFYQGDLRSMGCKDWSNHTCIWRWRERYQFRYIQYRSDRITHSDRTCSMASHPFWTHSIFTGVELQLQCLCSGNSQVSTATRPTVTYKATSTMPSCTSVREPVWHKKNPALPLAQRTLGWNPRLGHVELLQLKIDLWFIMIYLNMS